MSNCMCFQSELYRIEHFDRNLHNNEHRVSAGVNHSMILNILSE